MFISRWVFIPLALVFFFTDRAEATPSSSAVHERLMEWLLLTGPQGGNLPPEQYQKFLIQKPEWPARGRIFWRYQAALSRTTDPATLSALCPSFPLSAVNALLNCAPYLKDASGLFRTVWIGGAESFSDEQHLLASSDQNFTADDQWLRYQHLETVGQITGARRQIERLSPDLQALATARLAQKAADPEAESLFASLPENRKSDPVLVRYRLHNLRHAGHLDEALSLWTGVAAGLQAKEPSHEWSVEREELARALLQAGRTQEALVLADDQTRSWETVDRQDAAFLSGFILLRALHDPDRAFAAFSPLQNISSLTVRARGLYWMARSRSAAGYDDEARISYQEAARFPTTFYGQLSLAALTRQPDFLTADQPAFIPLLQNALASSPKLTAGTLIRPDLVLAATELSGMGDTADARLFLMMIQTGDMTASSQKAVADLSVQLAVPGPDVFAARALSRAGFILYPEGYPRLPASEQDHVLPSGLISAIARQESSFDPRAVSPAHAIGLLQLLPAAARDVARRAGFRGLDLSATGLQNPTVNVRIGSVYISQLLSRFNDVIPYTLAAYDAGPHRVDVWLAAQPTSGLLTQDELIDWIETLPYRETRLYIEHILADMEIYRTFEHHDAR